MNIPDDLLDPKGEDWWLFMPGFEYRDGKLYSWTINGRTYLIVNSSEELTAPTLYKGKVYTTRVELNEDMKANGDL